MEGRNPPVFYGVVDKRLCRWYKIIAMEKTVLNYQVILEKEKYPNGEFVYTVYCPALDIADYGDTIEAALESIKEALGLRLEVLAQEGEKIPQESQNTLITQVSIIPPQPVAVASV